MIATRRGARRWFALLALLVGWFVFSWGRLLASPMWYDRCETLASPFSSLHCWAPYLFLGGGLALLLTGGILSLLELLRFVRPKGRHRRSVRRRAPRGPV